MRPCGCERATSASSLLTERRTAGVGEWMRAMICGVTSSQRSAEISSHPACTAASTSARAPYLNQSVSSRSKSCSARSRPSAMDRKNPRTAGTTKAAAAASSRCCTASKLTIAHACHALYESGEYSVARESEASTSAALRRE